MRYFSGSPQNAGDTVSPASSRPRTPTPNLKPQIGEFKWNLRLVVIAPVAYRSGSNGKRLYRQPGYLIRTEPDLPLETLLQEYIRCWDIEVNHRDEKTIPGVGQAHVRNANSVEGVPSAAIAAYAMLHMAAMKAYGWNGKPNTIPPAKWRDPKKKKRASTQDLINELRREPGRNRSIRGI